MSLLRILYVDDEPALLDICRIFLEKGGDFEVITESSGFSALDRLAREHFDAAISDYPMPGMIPGKVGSEGAWQGSRGKDFYNRAS